MINILAALLLTLQQPTTNEVEQLLIDRAQVHGANITEVIRVVKCENRNMVPGLLNYSGSGAIGLFQWMRNGHWNRTPAYREHGISIHDAYFSGNSDALFYDADMGAWSFSPEAERMYPGNRRGWSCF